MEATSGFEPEDGGFADLCLTTWLRRLERVCWSGRRDLNPRLQPWQGCTLPLSYSRSTKRRFTVEPRFCQALFLKKHIFLFHLFRMPLNMSRMLFLCREPSGGGLFPHPASEAGERPSVAMPVLEAADQASVGNHCGGEGRAVF